MANVVPFRLYQLQNKAQQPAYIYLGKAKDGASEADSFYSHLLEQENACNDTYIFTSLIGSRNIKLHPATVENETNPDGTANADPFVYVNSRWYHWREWLIDTDNPVDLTPSNLIKTYNALGNGDYIIQWRKLTSDGSIFIKPSLTSNVFWNGNSFISDEEAFQTPFNLTLEEISDDQVYLKTLRYIDLVRNDTNEDAMSLIHEKYQDECLWKSTYLMKRLRGTRCIYVESVETDKAIEIGMRNDEDCQCGGCYECEEEFEDLNISAHRARLISIRESGDINEWRACLFRKLSEGTLNWLEAYEYNWLNNMCYNAQDCEPDAFVDEFPTIPDTYIEEYEQEVTMTLNGKAQRSNFFYGIDKNGIRRHHKVPLNYTYTSTHRVTHPDITFRGRTYPRYAGKTTSEITDGRIDDGRYRVPVPPGVIFRTYKAVPGVIYLSELDVITRRPDEYHFAVDRYANIFGSKTLPFPGLLEVDCPLKPINYNVENIPDATISGWIIEAWQEYFDSNTLEFPDKELLDLIQEGKIINNFYVLPQNCNGFGYLTGYESSTSSDSSSSSVSSSTGSSTSSSTSSSTTPTNNCFIQEDHVGCCGTHTYMNIHACPLWIDVDVFCSFLTSDDSTRQTSPPSVDSATVEGLSSFSLCSSLSSISSSSS